jgi:hypothetical protein
MAYTNIDDPSAHFQTATFAGDSSNSTVISNDGNSNLQPDFVWIKNRTLSGGNVSNNMLFNSSVGIGTGANSPYLMTDSNAAETTNSNALQAVSSNGFTPGSMTRTNETGKNFVAWQWKCNGGTTTTNTDGDINSTVQVNQDAGFSMVRYQPSNTTSRNIGHGLGTRPAFIIIRNRTRVENWRVWHHQVGTGGAILDNTSAYNTGTSSIVNTVNTTTFNVGGDFSVNVGYPIIAWCFAEKQGYSKFGSYTGNLALNGPFIYTGFKPAWIMVKRAVGGTSSYSGWGIHDSKRYSFNNNQGGNYLLWAHHPYSEGTRGQGGNNANGATGNIDILSNGFKIRDNGSDEFNDPSDTYIYMAFAEQPFVTSTGVPATAR